MAAALVRSAGFSGGAPLTPTWALHTRWPEVLGWAALLLALAGLLLLLQSLLRPEVPVLVAAAAVVAVCVAFLPGGSLLFAGVPLLAGTAVAFWRRGRLSLRHLRQPLLAHEPGFSFLVAFLLFAVPPTLLYPAMAWHEDNVRRRYALDAAPVQTLRHRFAVCHALEEATRTLDSEAASLARLRPDSAYRLWLSTGLPRLTVASALEVRGPAGERSRFGVGLPRRPDPPSSAPSPPPLESHPRMRGGIRHRGRPRDRAAVPLGRQRHPAGCRPRVGDSLPAPGPRGSRITSCSAERRPPPCFAAETSG